MVIVEEVDITPVKAPQSFQGASLVMDFESLFLTHRSSVEEVVVPLLLVLAMGAQEVLGRASRLQGGLGGWTNQVSIAPLSPAMVPGAKGSRDQLPNCCFDVLSNC